MQARDARDFLWVGNHPGLDLVNTEAVDARCDRLELVPDWPALVDWARSATLIDEELAEQCHQADERHGHDVLAWFHRLRTRLRAILEPTGDEPAAAQALDAAVADVPIRLSYQPAQAPEALPVIASRPLEQLRLSLATAALDAAQLDRTRIRRCASANVRAALLRHLQEPLAAMVRHGRMRQPSESQHPLPPRQQAPIDSPPAAQPTILRAVGSPTLRVVAQRIPATARLATEPCRWTWPRLVTRRRDRL